MLNLLSSLIDLGLAISVLCLLVMYFRLKKSLRQTDNIVDHNADVSIHCFETQTRINDQVSDYLIKIANDIEELKNPKTTKRGKDENAK